MAVAQNTAQCQFRGTFTSASSGNAFANNTTQPNCNVFALTWNSITFSALSIQIEGSDDGSSWTVYSGTSTVARGPNPSTALSGTIIVTPDAKIAFVRVRVTSVTGSGGINYQVYGYSGTSAALGSSAGGGGTCGALAGDVTGTCAANTVVKVNGAPVIANSPVVGTNSSGQIVAASLHTSWVADVGGSGVTINTLICVTNPAQADECPTTAGTNAPAVLGVALGTVIAGGSFFANSTPGSFQLCVFDNTAVLNDIVTTSTTTPGQCHDTGLTSVGTVSLNTPFVGIANDSGTGTREIIFFSPGTFGTKQTTSGTVTNVTGVSPITSTGGTTPAIGCATCVVNNGANTGTTAFTLDASASTSANAVKVPVIAGAAPSSNGAIVYDSTLNNLHAPKSAADAVITQTTATSAGNGNCVNWINSAGSLKLGDAGAPCGSGGGTGGGVLTYSGPTLTILSGTSFCPVGGGGACSATETNVDIDSSAVSTVSNMYVQLSTALGVGNSVVVTWRKNASSQTVTCTISGAVATSCNDTTHSFAVAQSDLLDYQLVFSGTIIITPTITIMSQFGTVNAGVTSVTATAPITSSGGTTPNISATYQGNGSKVQASTGSTITNDCVKFDANGNTVDAGAPCSTAAGTVTSVTATAPLTSTGGTTPVISATYQGNGAKVQASTGTTTANDCVKFDANSNTVDSGAACGNGVTSYNTLTGAITSPATFANNIGLPPTTSWTWDNQGTATVDTTGGYLYFNMSNPGGTNALRVYYRTAPSTPYTVCMAIWHDLSGMPPGNQLSQSSSYYGVFFRDGTGKLIGWEAGTNGTPNFIIQTAKWTNSTNFSAAYVQNAGPYYSYGDFVYRNPALLCERDDGTTNLTWYYSMDGGLHLQQFDQRTRTDFLGSGPTQIGVGVQLLTGSSQIALNGYKVCTEPATATCQ